MKMSMRKKMMKEIEKELLESGYSIEVESHQILTEKCTIDIQGGVIHVNDKPVEYIGDMVWEVRQIECGMEGQHA